MRGRKMLCKIIGHHWTPNTPEYFQDSEFPWICKRCGKKDVGTVIGFEGRGDRIERAYVKGKIPKAKPPLFVLPVAKNLTFEPSKGSVCVLALYGIASLCWFATSPLISWAIIAIGLVLFVCFNLVAHIHIRI